MAYFAETLCQASGTTARPAGGLDPAGAAFLDLLPSDGMRVMLRHWAECRPTSGALPQRPPFNPLLVPRELQNIQLHERHAGDRYFCRVSGSHIVAVLGFESTNRYVDQVIAAAHLKSRTALLNEALDSGRPIFYSGTLAIPGSEWRGMHRLLLPFMKGDLPCLLSLVRYLTDADLRQLAAMPDLDANGIKRKLILSEDAIAALRQSGDPV